MHIPDLNFIFSTCQGCEKRVSLDLFEFLFPHLIMDIFIPNLHDTMIKVRSCRFYVLGFTGERLHRALVFFLFFLVGDGGGKGHEGWMGIFYQEGRVRNKTGR